MHSITAFFLDETVRAADLDEVMNIVLEPYDLWLPKSEWDEQDDDTEPLDPDEIPINPAGRWESHSTWDLPEKFKAINPILARELRDRPDLESLLPDDFLPREGSLHSHKRVIVGADGTEQTVELPTPEWLAEFRAALDVAPDSFVAFTSCNC